MTPTSFGNLLRKYRLNTRDPETGRYLTQERLGSLIGEITGTPYTAQAVSDWERQRSQIHKDHRMVLIALVQVLQAYGGLETLEQANRWLRSGNYRALNNAEALQAFDALPSSNSGGAHPWTETLLTRMGAWFEMITPRRFFIAAFGGLLVLSAWLGIAPILSWPVMSQPHAVRAAIQYVLTSLLVPALIALLAAWNQSDRPAQERPLDWFLLRLIGSAIGFHLGFLTLLALSIFSYHLGLYPWPRLLLLTASAWSPILAFACACQAPRNQHKAYGKLHIKEYGPMLLSLLLPILLGGYYSLSYSWFLSRVTGPLFLLGGTAALGFLLFFWRRGTDQNE
jgi:hypothetical protein